MIDGGGRTLMPGFIDMHWHSMLSDIGLREALSADLGYLNAVASNGLRDALMRGFTSVRDIGSHVFGLKGAIDEGIATGPRIYPSGAPITQTSGHADYRTPNDLPAPGGEVTRYERMGLMAIADAVPEVRKHTREILMPGIPTSPSTPCRRYAELVRSAVPEGEWALIREALQREHLTGDARFIDEVAAILWRRIEPRKPGRPRQEAGK